MPVVSHLSQTPQMDLDLMLQGDSEDDELDELECEEGADEVDHDIDLESERLLDSVYVEREERESNSQS